MVYQNNLVWKTALLQATYSGNHTSIGLKSGPSGQSMVIDQSNNLFYTAAKSKPEDYVVILNKTDEKHTIVKGIEPLL